MICLYKCKPKVSEKHFNRQIIKTTKRGAFQDKLVCLKEEGRTGVLSKETKSCTEERELKSMRSKEKSEIFPISEMQEEVLKSSKCNKVRKIYSSLVMEGFVPSDKALRLYSLSPP